MGSILPNLMGALSLVEGVTSTVSNIRGDVDAISDRQERERRRQVIASQDLALQQLEQQQALEERQLRADNDIERRRIADEKRQAEEKRVRSLRNAVSRQRAQFGARGTGSAGGSADAVLLGFFDESEEDRTQRERMDNLRTQALNLSENQLSSLNVLQRTQLQQKNNLQRSTL